MWGDCWRAGDQEGEVIFFREGENHILSESEENNMLEKMIVEVLIKWL